MKRPYGGGVEGGDAFFGLMDFCRQRQADAALARRLKRQEGLREVHRAEVRLPVKGNRQIRDGERISGSAWRLKRWARALQDPADRQLPPRPSWQPETTGPPIPVFLQKPRTAHLASSRIRVTCGFSYFFFL